MTAEIGILNKTGVALAADSAVTISSENKEKIFNFANKLFSLSKDHAIGIMVYDSAAFMGIPWETIIKMYRKHVSITPFAKTEDYLVDFLNYLVNTPIFYSETAENDLISSKFSWFLNLFLKQIEDTLGRLFKGNPPLDMVEKIVHAEIYAFNDYYQKIEFNESFDKDDIEWFVTEKAPIIVEAISRYFNYDVDEETMYLFIEVGASIIMRKINSPGSTGLVISGFGEDELFPSLYSSVVHGIFNGKLIIVIDNVTNISLESSSVIIPFAQKEMVESFMNGIDPKINEKIEEELHDTLTNLPDVFNTVIGEMQSNIQLSENEKEEINKVGIQLYENFKQEIAIYKRKHSLPIMEAVNFLPKEEMASMAEALVNLTSLKRKVTIDSETVGGPIDVAVITKGDGFIWIKRKHYFDPKLNHHFFGN